MTKQEHNALFHLEAIEKFYIKVTNLLNVFFCAVTYDMKENDVLVNRLLKLR